MLIYQGQLQIDTARKLRWYDREELSQLISISTREKQELQDTITALRQVPHPTILVQGLFFMHLISAPPSSWGSRGFTAVSVFLQVILASGTSEQELDSDLQDRLAEAEHQQDTDASLNSVLVLAAQAEIDQLRNVITSSAQVKKGTICMCALQLVLLHCLGRL